MIDADSITTRVPSGGRMAGFLDNKKRITLACFLAYFVMSGMLAPIGIISGPISELFGQPITDVTTQFGWLTFGILAGAAATLVVFSFMRVKTVLLLVYSLTVASLVSLVFASELTTIGIALGIVGFCSGLGLAAAATVLSKTYEAERRASMLVITDAFFSTAGFLCAAIATALVAAAVHWAGTYQFVAIIAAIVVVLTLVSQFPEGQAETGADESGERWPLNFWLCVVALFLYTLGQYSLLWWIPNYAETQLGASVEQAGRPIFWFWVGLAAAQVFVAWWVIRVGVSRLVMLAAIGTCLFSIPLWAFDSVPALPVFAFLWGFANLGLLKVVLSYATQTVKVPTPRLVSTILLGATLGTAVSPWVTSSIVVATDNYFVLQFGTICYATLATILFIVVRRVRSQSAALQNHK